MASVTVSTVIKRPIEDVFDYVADTRNDVQWAPLVAYAELVEGDEPGLGTVYRIGQRGGPKPMPVLMTTATFERPTKVAWTSSDPRVDYLGTVEFRDEGGATRMTHTNTLTFNVPLAGLAWKLLATIVLRRQLANLRRVLED